jgi:hypothetical protein
MHERQMSRFWIPHKPMRLSEKDIFCVLKKLFISHEQNLAFEGVAHSSDQTERTKITFNLLKPSAYVMLCYVNLMSRFRCWHTCFVFGKRISARICAPLTAISMEHPVLRLHVI